MKVFSLIKLSFHFSGYDKVFEIIRQMKGGARVRCLIVKYILIEARRQRKKLLIEMLDEFKLNLSQNTKLPW